MSDGTNNGATGEGMVSTNLGKFLVYVKVTLATIMRAPSPGAKKAPMVENGTDTDGNTKYCLPKGPTDTGLTAMQGLAEAVKRKMNLHYNGAQKVEWKVSGKVVHKGSRHHLDIILKAIYAWEQIVHSTDVPEWPRVTAESTQDKIDAAKEALQREHDAEMEAIKQRMIANGVSEEEADAMINGGRNPVTSAA